MKPFHTRVIQVGYEWRPAERWRIDRTRIVVTILYPLAIKRQLATLEAASVRAARAGPRHHPARPIPAAQAGGLDAYGRGESSSRLSAVLGGGFDFGRRHQSLDHRGRAGARLPVLASPVRPRVSSAPWPRSELPKARWRSRAGSLWSGAGAPSYRPRSKAAYESQRFGRFTSLPMVQSQYPSRTAFTTAKLARTTVWIRLLGWVAPGRRREALSQRS